jgi:hypothetical protein
VLHNLFSGNFQPFSIPMPVTTKSDVLVSMNVFPTKENSMDFTGSRDQGSEQEPRGKAETNFPLLLGFWKNFSANTFANELSILLKNADSMKKLYNIMSTKLYIS